MGISINKVSGGSTPVVAPYTVFTALVTQSGESDYVNQTSGLFTIGVTYTIDIYISGDDFSNIGGPPSAPNGAWDGFSFIATGTTALNYTNGTGIDHNNGAPVVTILENTIGNVWFEYGSVGQYSIYLENASYNKIFCPLQIVVSTSLTFGNISYKIQTEDDNLVTIVTKITDTGEQTDDILPNNTPIEIRVYN